LESTGIIGINVSTWHDAERIEPLLDEGTVVSGAALALSNYPFWDSRWAPPGGGCYRNL